MAIPKIAPYRLDDALLPVDGKVDWTIEPKKAVLLVHDMQAYFADFYDCSQEPIATMIANLQQLIKSARSNGIPVVYTAQPTNQDPSDRALLTDFWGIGLQDSYQSHHILNDVAPQINETVYTKWRYSAFQKSTFEADLRAQQKTQIIIAGVYAHIGILSTALDGFMRDFQCFVIEDAVADFSAEEHLWARRWIAGRCGKLYDTTATIEQINSATAQHDIDIKALVSNILETPISDISDTDNLADWGLDSVRLMAIADQLKASGSAIDFMALAERPTLSEWQAMLGSRSHSHPSN